MSKKMLGSCFTYCYFCSCTGLEEASRQGAFPHEYFREKEKEKSQKSLSLQ
jgi:hypothetical protein